MGRYDEAAPRLDRAIEIRRKALGDEHRTSVFQSGGARRFGQNMASQMRLMTTFSAPSKSSAPLSATIIPTRKQSSRIIRCSKRCAAKNNREYRCPGLDPGSPRFASRRPGAGPEQCIPSCHPRACPGGPVLTSRDCRNESDNAHGAFANQMRLPSKLETTAQRQVACTARH